MSDCRLTTFDNPYDPFEQFTLWWLFDNEKGYNTCGKLDRISHFTDDMSDKEIDEEHERAVDEIIDIRGFQIIDDVVWVDSAVYTKWYDFWRTNAVIGGNKNFQ